MKKLEFRELIASEIECRVATVNQNGITLLLYKNARCDMAILDETVGPEKWQREHYECKGNLFCRVGICIDNEWIWKSDCGTESYSDKEKGEASDSFKRACVNWGIGRELYAVPFIWIPASNCKIKETEDANTRKKKYKCDDKFYAKHVKIVDKKVIELIIANKKDDVDVFVFDVNSTTKKSKKQSAKQQDEQSFEIKCKQCGKVIKAVKKGEKIISANEVAESCQGYCLTCYKAVQKGNA